MLCACVSPLASRPFTQLPLRLASVPCQEAVLGRPPGVVSRTMGLRLSAPGCNCAATSGSGCSWTRERRSTAVRVRSQPFRAVLLLPVRLGIFRVYIRIASSLPQGRGWEPGIEAGIHFLST